VHPYRRVAALVIGGQSGQYATVPSDEPRIAGFSTRVRAEHLDGAHLGEGWGIFHRYGSVDATDAAKYLEWDGYLEVKADGAEPMWFTRPFRVVPDPPDHGEQFPSIIVTTRNWRPLDGERVGLLVVEDDPTTDP